MYGGGVELATGRVFLGKFSYHGPDTDIRSLRIQSTPPDCLHSLYDPLADRIVIQPFSYRPAPDAKLWLRKVWMPTSHQLLALTQLPGNLQIDVTLYTASKTRPGLV